ncbi:MAG: hypothetical protein HY903_17355 [Deltaproteobacteria bacterium]|nr:hypothetical protein [Deltaproteobacteria bacterium]
MVERDFSTVWVLVTVTALGVGAGCTKSGDGCSKNGDCTSGQACVDGACATLCRADSECPAEQRCSIDHCVSRSIGGSPPIIVAVNGSGSIDSAAGHTARHLNDRLVITGYNLAQASAQLLAESGAPFELAPCVTPTDTELQVRLPPEVPAGKYSLVVANQAGACDATLQLLQGEPGSLNASGSLIVSSINDALGTDPQLRLRGALPTGAHVSFVTAVGSGTLGASSIVVNDQEQVGAGENDSAGLYLVIVDLATHAVVNQSAGAGMSSKGPFLASEATKLRDVLVWADSRPELTDYAVILASVGDVRAMAAMDGNADPSDPNDLLWVELQRLGATQRVRTLGAAESYVLIGQKGVGEGNGLEQVGKADRNGVATMATAVVGGAVVGLGAGRTVASSTIVDQSIEGRDMKVPTSFGAITVTGTTVGVNVAAPAAALDVGGGINASGKIIGTDGRSQLYRIPNGCGGAGTVVTAPGSCTTACCYAPNTNCWYYYACGGSCPAWGPPTTCNFDFLGYLH